MLPFEFIATNIHFTIAILAAAVCFATYWLYFDAWSESHHTKELLKWLGFALLALGFLVRATQIEPIFLTSQIFQAANLIELFLQGLGYLLVIIGVSLDPIEPTPSTKPLVSIWAAQVLGQPASVTNIPDSSPRLRRTPIVITAIGLAIGIFAGHFRLTLLAAIIAVLYWQRALRGLERHLKRVALAFTLLTLFELADTARYFADTTDPRLYNLVAPFGPIWIIAELLLLSGILILGRWVWQYLTKRLQTQLFMVLISASMSIFIITTISFTFLLMNRMQTSASAALQTTAKVLSYAVSGKLSETSANAQITAHDPAIAAAVSANDHRALAVQLEDFLSAKKQSSLIITNASGQILYRAEDPARWGDSVSGDTLVNRALIGQTTSGLIADEKSFNPHLTMRTTTPIRSGGNIIGTVSVGLTANNAFVDGLQHTAGTAASVYSGTTRVATTLLEADGHTRSTGAHEANKSITGTVLGQGKTWSGRITTGGEPYLAVYVPLTDADNDPVGMLFLGQPEATLFQAAGWAIELTFLISAGLLLLAIVPLHLVSRSLARQLH